MKVKIDTSYMWGDLSDSDRLKLIVELINTAPDVMMFVQKLKNNIKKLEID